jgi:hypothetical protein
VWILRELLAGSFCPSLEDVPILAEFPIRVSLIACFQLLTVIVLFCAGKKCLGVFSDANAVHESFRRAASSEFRGSNEIDVPEFVFN